MAYSNHKGIQIGKAMNYRKYMEDLVDHADFLYRELIETLDKIDLDGFDYIEYQTKWEKLSRDALKRGMTMEFKTIKGEKYWWYVKYIPPKKDRGE